METKRPVVLAIIDGFGVSEIKIGNAVQMAQKPNLDFIAQNYPHTLLQASGEAVGLDFGEVGNSEVGHMNLGAGRIVKHYSTIINAAIKDGSFATNSALARAVEHAKTNQGTLHIAGLLTAGSVHAQLGHLIALVELAKATPTLKTYLHLFTDGKDSGLYECTDLLKKLEPHLAEAPNVTIATAIGRDWAMDRNKRWDHTQVAYQLITEGAGEPTDAFATSFGNYHQQEINDMRLPALVARALPKPLMKDGDALIFFNFREDSMRQISRAFTEPRFSKFPVRSWQNLYVAGFTQYIENPALHVAFGPYPIKNNLAEWLSNNGKKQFHIAESEKYAHVTLFFNGLHDQPYASETDQFMESIEPIGENTVMRAADIAQAVVAELEKDESDFILLNFANADMLSHLGNLEKVASGIGAIDDAMGTVYQKVKEKNGILVITADHGNAESLIYTATGERETKHNNNPVPCYIVAEEYFQKVKLPTDVSGILGDVAPTVLELMGLSIPNEMTGQSLLRLLVET